MASATIAGASFAARISESCTESVATTADISAIAATALSLAAIAALATVVGVLVEVPVMLSLVAIANRNQRLFPS